jgi:hypothetical protein
MALTVCPETSVRNYHYTLRNIPEVHRSLALRSETLKSTGEVVAGLRCEMNVERLILVMERHQATCDASQA